MRRDNIKDMLCKLYLPHNNNNDEIISNVDMFLQGKVRFKSVFNIDIRYEDMEKASKLIILGVLHCMDRKVFTIDKDCINRSLLMRKNVSNKMDILGNSFFHHAKGVEANCKKALSLCLSKNSP